MLTFESSGSFSNIESFLKNASKRNILSLLEGYGSQGVAALSVATPADSGLTAASWNFEVEEVKGSYTITWTNSNVVNGVPIAIILQYGHGTGTGGYVEGRDYINPVMKPIFDKIEADVWKAVTSG